VQQIHNIGYLSAYIGSWGYWAPLAALVLFALQSLLPLFPYSILVAVAVVLFGGTEGFLIAIIGAMTGSLICYYLSGGRTGQWFSGRLLKWFGYDVRQVRSGMAFSGIVLAHLIQLVPNAVINFMASLSRIPLSSYLLSSILGLLPVTLAYAGVGILMAHMENAYQAMKVMAAILLLLFLGKNFLKGHWQVLANVQAKYFGRQGQESLSVEKSKA
jgi:uncharacterized membrane protein YdjX (TVP38/TMEM64 family)